MIELLNYVFKIFFLSVFLHKIHLKTGLPHGPKIAATAPRVTHSLVNFFNNSINVPTFLGKQRTFNLFAWLKLEGLRYMPKP